MAISRDKKQSLVAEMGESLKSSKLIAFAAYSGLSVADMQELRAMAREANVTIKVIKNRLVKVAMQSSDTHKDTDTSALNGQLVYAMSNDDEVAPAQVLDKFAKKHPQLVLTGAFSNDGTSLGTDEVKALAGLPSKEQLIAEVVAQLLSPVTDVTSGLSGNLHGLLDAVSAKAA